MPSRPSPRSGLLQWLDDPAAAGVLRCIRPDGNWDAISLPELAVQARRIAAGLIRAGIRGNDRVAVVSGSDADFVASVYGVLRAGATVCVLLPPPPLGGGDYAGRVLAAIAALEPAALVAPAALHTQLDQVIAGRPQVPVHDPAALVAAGDGADESGEPPADVALIQFTSGTTGRPRAVRIPRAALEANTRAIRTWLEVGGEDSWASWLPMHHDMGLVGCLFAPLAGGNGVWLTRPEDFIRDPLPYLRCFGAHNATITATPGFGLDRILRRVGPEALAGLDFSGWRVIVAGAERIDPGLLRRFEDLLRPHGLGPTTITPAYGLAEATLAVTGNPVRERWRDADPLDGSTFRIVGCGRPIGDFTVRVLDEAGCELPDGAVGEVEVRGSQLAAGYLDPSAASARLRQGVLLTGDAGFLEDGELYVLGRLGDSVKVRGRSVFAEDVELLLSESGLPAHRFAMALGLQAGQPVAVAVLERPEPDWEQRARALLVPACAGAAIIVVTGPAGTIPRTTSGKLRRRELWRAFVAGDLVDRRVGAASGAGRQHTTHGPLGPELEGHSRYGV